MSRVAAIGGTHTTRDGLLTALLPGSVALCETRGDSDESELFVDELPLIVNAVPQRRAEFTTARACARRALAALGVPPAAILPGTRGAPNWPAGIRGSMTHCMGFRAAAVARTSHVWSLGVDAEPHQPLPGGVAEVVALPAEQEHLAALTRGAPGVAWDRVLFSAKESVFKTWYPVQDCWLDFEQARLTIDPERGVFRAQLLVPGPVLDGRRHDVFAGRFAVLDGLVLTSIVLEK